MAQLVVLTSKTAQAIDGLTQRISSTKWGELTRTSFVYNTTQTINALQDMGALFEEIGSELKSQGFGEKIELKEHINEIEFLIKLLQRNKDLETTRIQKAREKGIESLAENVIVPELYTSLEQKVLGMTLKSRFFLERLNIHLRKDETTQFAGTKSTKNVLDLLDEKETELQGLREKIESLKTRGFVASLSEKTTADTEHELNEFSRKMHTNSKLLFDAFEVHQKKLSELEYSQRQFEEKMNFFDELQQQHFEKTLDLVTALKKERDYAKKLVLDIEGETLALRNTYSQKLLSLEQEKAREKSAAFENFREKIQKQENDLKDKEQLIGLLRENLETKELEIKKLQEKSEKTAQTKAGEKNSGKKTETATQKRKK